MNGLIQNDLLTSILALAALTLVARLLASLLGVGMRGLALSVVAGYAAIYLLSELWSRSRNRRGGP